MTQGERVRTIRKHFGLTLEKFGQKLGVSKSAVSNIENGSRNLTDQMIKSICREYHINLDYLLYGDGEMFDNLPETLLDELCDQYNLDEIDRSIINIYLTLPDETKNAIKKHIKTNFGKKST